MRQMTLSEDDVKQLKVGDPLDYHDGDGWVAVTVVEIREDTVVVTGTEGDWQVEAEWGELRG